MGYLYQVPHNLDLDCRLFVEAVTAENATATQDAPTLSRKSKRFFSIYSTSIRTLEGMF